MSINEEQARQVAQATLDATFDGHDPNRVIVDAMPLSDDGGWVFFYDSRAYLETGDFSRKLVGNAPIVVDRDGRPHITGTAAPLEHYLAELRRDGVIP
jgi:hypothetical protein